MDQDSFSSSKGEATVSHRFMPGCRNCGSINPLAMHPVPLRTDVCAKCGEPIPVYDAVTVPAKVTGGFDIFVARWFINVGAWLRRLSEKGTT